MFVLLVALTLVSGAPGATAGSVTTADDGVQPALFYDGPAFDDLAGGVRRGTTYLGTLRLQLTVDAFRLAGFRGMTLFVEGLNIRGGHPSRFAGDEVWIQQNLFRNQLSILIGRYDLTTEFYRLQSAGLFLNSSFGIGPEFSQSGRSGPSIFPDTSVGTRIAWKLARGVVLRTAILDGVPVERPTGRKIFARGDGLLLVEEAAYLFRPTNRDSPRNPQFRLGRVAGLPPYTAKIALGTWHYTAKYPDLSEPVLHSGSSGAYVLADVSLARQLMLFGQFGIGDARVNPFAKYTGAGIVKSGPLKGRDNDELGLAIAAAHNAAGAETTIDYTDLAPVNSRLAIQPDLQYVLHPSVDGTKKTHWWQWYGLSCRTDATRS